MTDLNAHPSVVHMFAEAARRWPEREALVCEDERLTYAQYRACVAALANELIGRGARGGRIALVMGNGIDICIAMFAAHAAGAQVVPLNPLYTGRELGLILEDADAHVIIHDSSVAEVLEPLLSHRPVPHVIRVGGPAGRRLMDPRSDPHAPAARMPEAFPDPSDLATLQYTGGTTGRSKGVNLSHRAVATNIAQREALLPAGRDGERLLCMMPLFHSYAVAMCLHNAVNCGGALVIMPRFTPEALFDLMPKERITILAGSPTVFTALVKHEKFSADLFHNLRISYSGASALPEALLRRWEAATRAPVLEGYGQSESGPVLTFNPLHGPRKPQSVGIPLPQTQIQIVDPQDPTLILGPGHIGEIRARGPQVMNGYRNRPEETTQALRDGWLYTGDLGEFDADGYLYVRDRKKDMLLVSGFNVYPREVEEVLALHPAVLEAAVVGVPDEQRGARVKAFVVCRPGASATAEMLDAHCRQNLAAYKVPRQYVMLERLPKTSVGKIDKKQLN
jgi:long-chain acyl-CoA synthetase